VASFLGFTFGPFCALSELIFLWTKDCLLVSWPCIGHTSTFQQVCMSRITTDPTLFLKALTHEFPFFLTLPFSSKLRQARHVQYLVWSEHAAIALAVVRTDVRLVQYYRCWFCNLFVEKSYGIHDLVADPSGDNSSTIPRETCRWVKPYLMAFGSRVLQGVIVLS
jgi:hypothetical protein